VAKQVVRDGLSVRETERIVSVLTSDTTNRKPKKSRGTATKSAEHKAIEEELIKALGTRVSVEQRGKGGEIRIHYYSAEELEGLIELLRKIGE
jgi:ParB family chromosome partitioning protein